MRKCNEFWLWFSSVDLGNILTVAGNFLTGIGTIALAWAAYKALPDSAKAYKEAKLIDLSAQREKEKSLKFQNKFNLARDAIRIFNHLRSDIQQIRSPLAFEGELKRLQDLPEDNELIKKMKQNTSAGLTFLRMDDRSESLAEMNRLEPEYRAVFGETDAFNKMRNARRAVWVAAQMMAQGGAVKDYNRAIFSFGSEDNDEILNNMNLAVKEIEELCRPVLAGD